MKELPKLCRNSPRPNTCIVSGMFLKKLRTVWDVFGKKTLNPEIGGVFLCFGWPRDPGWANTNRVFVCFPPGWNNIAVNFQDQPSWTGGEAGRTDRKRNTFFPSMDGEAPEVLCRHPPHDMGRLLSLRPY